MLGICQPKNGYRLKPRPPKKNTFKLTELLDNSESIYSAALLANLLKIATPKIRLQVDPCGLSMPRVCSSVEEQSANSPFFCSLLTW